MSIIPMAEDRTHESVVGCAWLMEVGSAGNTGHGFDGTLEDSDAPGLDHHFILNFNPWMFAIAAA